MACRKREGFMRSALWFMVLTVVIGTIPLAQADDNRIHFNNQDLFLNGLNLAWDSFANDIGSTTGTPDLVHFEDVFSQMEAGGSNCMRLWLHTTGAYTPAWSGSTVTGPGTDTIADIEAILDLAWEHKISMMLCLWSFDMLRISNGATITDRALDILTDSTYRQSYIDNALIPMVSALQGHPAILAWEIFNEPEGMSNEHGWSFNYHVPMADVQAFINVCAGAIHRTDPTVMVTNGCWSFIAGSDEPPGSGNYNYYTDARLIAAGGDADGTLDFYCVHYYDWGADAICPFTHDASYWGLDKPLVIAEFFPDCDYCTSDPHETLYQRGYAGALGWSWTDRDPLLLLAEIEVVSSAHPGDVLIIPPGRPVPPTASITWPTDNIKIRENADLTIFADAEDTDGTVAKVEFFEDTNKLGEDTTGPFDFTWNNIPSGNYSLTVRATDSNDLTGTSPAVYLVVGGNTVPQETRYEAEDAAFSGTISVGSDGAASGGQYLDMRNNGTITWTTENIPAAGEYDLKIGFQLAYGSPKTQYLSVNGGPQTEITFSGGTSAWLETTTQVSLNTGTNTIEIDGYWSWMYFDYIDIIPPALCAEGDLNLDCAVDIKDLAILAVGWLNPYTHDDFSDVSYDWLE